MRPAEHTATFSIQWRGNLPSGSRWRRTMTRRHPPGVRRRALATMLGAALAALATMPQTVAAAAVEGCPGGGPLVVNAYGTYRNAADFGADGHVWALDAARESIQIWQIGSNTYCFKRQDIGTFTTFAGVSPEGRAQCAAA